MRANDAYVVLQKGKKLSFCVKINSFIKKKLNSNEKKKLN